MMVRKITKRTPKCLKKIADERFQGRLGCILKKAHELGTLCGSDVHLVILRDRRYYTYTSKKESDWPPTLEHIDASGLIAEHKTPSDYFPAPRINFSTHHGEGKPPVPSELLVSPTANGEEYQYWSFLQQAFQEQSAHNIHTVFSDGGLIIGDAPQQENGISSSWIQVDPGNDPHQGGLHLAPQPVKKYDKIEFQQQGSSVSVKPSEPEHTLKHECDSSGLSPDPTIKLSLGRVDNGACGILSDDIGALDGFWSSEDVVYIKNCDDGSLDVPDLLDIDHSILAPSSKNVDMAAVVKFLEEYVETSDTSVHLPESLRGPAASPPLKKEPHDA